MPKRRPRLSEFIREARAYHPEARSPHFAILAALRAELLYGISAEEAYRKITGKSKKPRDDEQGAIVDTMVELAKRDEATPMWRNRDRIGRLSSLENGAFEEAE